MTNEEAAKLVPGIYLIFFSEESVVEEGEAPDPTPYVLAAVGQSTWGSELVIRTSAVPPPWFAPVNWLHNAGSRRESGVPCTDWEGVKKVVRLTTRTICLDNDPGWYPEGEPRVMEDEGAGEEDEADGGDPSSVTENTAAEDKK